jgi:hypothetical protein
MFVLLSVPLLVSFFLFLGEKEEKKLKGDKPMDWIDLSTSGHEKFPINDQIR